MGNPRQEIRYVLEDVNARFYFSANAVHIVFLEPQRDTPKSESGGVPRTNGDERQSVNPVRARRVDMIFEGSSPAVLISGEERQAAAASFYSPRFPNGLHGAHSYGVLRYQGLYPGIDLEFQADSGGVKYAFVLHPGSDISAIRIRYEGADHVEQDGDGILHIPMRACALTDAAPIAWTAAAGGHEFRRKTDTGSDVGAGAPGAGGLVAVKRKLEYKTVSFEAAAYDKDRILILDPHLQWSTYYGGASPDYARAAVIDADRNLTVAGYTMSVDFPVTPGATQDQLSGKLDLFIARFDPSRSIQWSTYYGGSGEEENPRLGVAPDGGVVIAASTTSQDAPVSSGAFQPQNNGKNDIILLKLDRNGRRVWGTYFGGGLSDECAGLSVAPSGEIVLVGGTFSTNFPVTRGAFQTTNSGDFDAFVARFSSSGTRLWATYVGGWGMDYAGTVAVGSSGGIYAAGHTESSNFPVSNGASQTRYGGGPFDMFLARFSETGAPSWITYFGGAKEDRASHVSADPMGRIHLSGYSESTNLPVSETANQNSSGGAIDGVVAEFDTKGALQRATYLGGRGIDIITSHAVDAGGNLLIAGQTDSKDFPVTDDAFQRRHSGAYDAFLTRFNSAGNLVFSTYYGGKEQEIPYAIAVEKSGNAILAGITASTDFPTTAALQKRRAGFTDAFLLRVVFDEPVANAGPDTLVCIGESVVIGRTASGGKPPYTYSWKPGSGLNDDAVMSPLSAPRKTTVYEVTVTDAEGASSSDSVTVSVKSLPRAHAGKNIAVCRGAGTTIGAPASGGLSPYWYSWFPAEGLSATDIPAPTASPDRTTTYTLTVRDMNGCIAMDSVTITVHPAVVAEAGESATICAGGSVTLGTPASGGKGPYSYLWSPSAGLSSTKSARPAAKPDSTTTYMLTVTDSRGCSSQDSVTVRVLTRILVDAGPDHSICPGEQVRIGGIASSGKAPHVYSWVPSAGLSNPTIPQPLASPDESAVYVLTVTDANGCSGQDSVRVLVNRVVIADAGPDVDLCEGGRARIGKPATGGSPPYKYVWTPAKGLSDASAESPDAAPSAGTRYILTVSDALGCMDRDTVTVAVNSSPRIKTDPDFSLCRGSRRKISASVRGGKAPFHYEWAPRRGLSAYDVPNPIASPDTTTVYTVTTTDANGCNASDTLVIIVRPCSRSDAGPDMELCLDGETALGGAAADPAEEPKYFWTPSTGLNATNVHRPQARPAQTTTYILRVTNMYGCESLDTVNVTVHPRPSGGAGPPVSFCEGGRAVIGTEASGGLPPYSYSWEPAVGLSESNAARPIAEPSVSTEYTLTVTDARGCSISDKVQVTVLPRPTAEAGPDMEICSGGAVNLGTLASGGRGPFTYDWKPAFGLDNPGAAKPRAAPGVTTTYHLTVTNSEGCRSADSVTVTVHAAPRPVLQADGPTTFCEGGSVVLDPGEDYAKYRWSDGSESRLLHVRRSGTYSLTAFEEHGCSGTSSPVTVRVLPSPRPRITARGPLQFCEGESVTLDAGPGYASYRWSTGEEVRTISVRNSGIYAVTVANKEGCSVCSDSLTVAVHPRPVVEVIRRRDTLSVTPAASYQWLAGGKPVRGAQRREFVARESGSYSVIVKNEDGCAAVSAPVQVVFGSAAAVLPRKTARRGKRVDVPLELASVKDLDRAGARAFEAVIRVKKKELTLLDTTIAAREEGGDLLLTLRGARTPGSRVLATIPFIAGERPARIPIVLESFKWLDGLARATTRNGEIRVLR